MRGGGMMGGGRRAGEMMGGRVRRARGMMGGRMHRRGRGWFTNFLKGAFGIGKKIFNIATDKRVHGLVKHGVKTYRDVRSSMRKSQEQAKPAPEAPAPTTPESGEGMRRRKGRRRARGIRVKGRGNIGLYRGQIKTGSGISGPLP
jgi:hypothetical protein